VSKKLVWWIIGIVAVVLLGAAVRGPIVSDVEHPKYTLIERSGAIEIRAYAPMIVAETEVTGERREAISKGFRLIADYIFGNNTAAQNVPMTAPVTQQGDGKSWRVRFLMPSKYTMETLPKPNNPAVVLKEIPGKRFAAICFSGMGGKDSLDRHTNELEEFISATTYAFYNPPWTLPFLRRNEVMVETAGPRD